MVPPSQWFPGTDGWVTTDNLKPVFTALRRSVWERAPGANIVLIMDSASQHTNRSVLMHASRLGLHVILVPSGLTWLLQPLDSHVFAHLKRVLADEQGRRRGVLPRGVWVEIVEHAIKQVLVDGVGADFCGKWFCEYAAAIASANRHKPGMQSSTAFATAY